MNVYKLIFLKEWYKLISGRFWKRSLVAIIQNGSGYCINSKSFIKINFSQNELAFEIYFLCWRISEYDI